MISNSSNFQFSNKKRMLQWKHLQLSSQDYQNYINNEDEQSIKINDLNIQEWQQLYHLMQTRSLMNKNIKKSMLTYQNNMKKLSGQSNIVVNPKDLQKLYLQYNCELKIKISDLYDQLGMLHLNNITTTVQLIISRLLSIEQDFFNIILQNNIKIKNLQNQLLEAEFNKKRNVCSQCTEHFQKIRNKYLKSQIIAGEEPDFVIQQAMNLNSESEKIRKYMREEIKLQEHQYDVQRYNYMNQVEQALKNRDKTLRFSNSPLQNILTDYLHQMLAMLQAKKLNFAPKGISQFDRVNRSYETLQDMKKLFKSDEFLHHISKMLSEPFSNFSYKIEQHLKGCLDKHKGLAIEAQTQTIFVNQFDMIKNLQKQCNKLADQIESIRASKMKMENDILQNLEMARKYQTKMAFLTSKNKQLQTDNKKLELQINQMQIELEHIHLGYKTQKANMIDTIANEKSTLVNEKKRLEVELRKFGSIKEGVKIVNKSDEEVQTQHEVYIEYLKQHEKLKKSTFKKRTHKKLSIKLLEQINEVRGSNEENKGFHIKSSKIATKSPIRQMISARLSQQSKISIKVGNSNNLVKISKISKEPVSLKVSRVNPLKFPGKQDYQCAVNQLQLRDSSLHQNQRSIDRRSHSKLKTIKMNGPIRGHCYHRSEFSSREPQNTYQSERLTQLSNLANKLSSSKVIPFSRFRQNMQCSSQNNYMGKADGTSSKQNNRYQQSETSHQKQHARRLISEDEKSECMPINLVSQPTPCQDERQSSRANKKLTEFMNFCFANYEELERVNAFSRFQEEALKMNQFRKSNKHIRSSIEEEQAETLQPSKSIKCEIVSFNKQNVEDLFISAELSTKYEKNLGIWSQLDGCLMIDNHFSSISEQIQIYFKEVRTTNPEHFKQCLTFLTRPHFFLNKGFQSQTKKPHLFQQLVSRMEKDKNWIKNIFRKIFKVHKILHKRCNHIQQFLQHIGFAYK